jgi:chromate transporter
LWGIKPAVVALVLFAAYRIGKKTLQHAALKIIALAALVAVGVAHIAFPWVILLAALVGWLLRHRLHQAVDLSALAVSKQAQPLRTSLLRTLLVSGVIFGLTIGWLLWQFGAQHMLVKSAWFYSKSAMLTFGGAYAVLPYIADALVQQLQWLSAAQMMDGLALGETTPGPLIMVISFVSFVAGWNQAVLSPSEGTQALLWAGLLSSSVATFFTFFPSYVMVLLGAPLIQASGQQIHLKAPLSAISAAVVGVIVNLALYFAKDVFLLKHSAVSTPNLVSWHIDFAALALSLLSFMLLKKHQASPLYVILACAGLGVLHAFI